MKQHLVAICTAMLILFAVRGSAAATYAAPVVYTITTTVNAELTLPMPAAEGQHLRRDRKGQWKPLEAEIDDGRIRFRLELEDMDNGETMIVLNCPPNIDLEDRRPPSIIRIEVDGEVKEAADTVDLGSLPSPPAKIAITFADNRSNLVPESIRVLAAGAARTIDDPGVSWHADTLKRGTVSIDLREIFKTAPDGHVTVTATIDDTALDREVGSCTISFTHTAPYVLPNKRVLAVDSVTDSPGWAKWWVIADGVKMDESMSTTAGYTWLSQPTDGPHWVQMTFPEPRQIKTVRLWWAYYQTYRTSRAYRVEVLPSAGDWRTVTEVTDQEERQVSEHSFSPVMAKAVRIWQPPMSGQSERAEHMWLSEIEVE